MRIIYLTSSLPYGKKEAFIIPEIEELRRCGYEVLLVPTYPRGDTLHGDVEPLLQYTVSEPLLSPKIVKATVRNLMRAPATVLRAFSYLFESRSVNVLLRNLAVFPKSFWLADLARKWKADHIHVHWATVPATMALIAGEISSIPWSVTTHRFDIAEDNLLDIKARKACFLRAINHRGAREIVDRVSPEASPPVVIHMGVALPSRVDETRESRSPAPRMVVAANLLEVKGHAYLLEAVHLLKERGVDVCLDIVGDGPLRGALAEKVEQLKLADRVTFLGLLPHEKLLAQMESGTWDLFVLPSIVTDSGEKEGIPVALIEAMSYRLPVVSTTTGGIPELFEGVSDALLVPPREPMALAEAIERLSGDSSLRDHLVKDGRRRVEDSFAVERVVAELAKRFETCGKLEG